MAVCKRASSWHRAGDGRQKARGWRPSCRYLPQPHPAWSQPAFRRSSHVPALCQPIFTSMSMEVLASCKKSTSRLDRIWDVQPPKRRGVPTGLPKGCSATPHLFRATPVNRPDPRRSGQCIYRGGVNPSDFADLSPNAD